LILNIQSVNQNGALALSAVIGGTNSGKSLLFHTGANHQTGRRGAGQMIDDKKKSSHLERNPSNSSFEIS
jgi:hypothetical protein